MDGVHAGFGSNPLLDAGFAPVRANAMAAAAADGDLGAHLQDLADDGRLLDFLDQTGDAITLAQGDQTFAEQLDPLLGRLRDALAEFPTDQLSRVERDAVESTRQALDADQIGRAHVCTPVTNAHLVCRLLLEKKKDTTH